MFLILEERFCSFTLEYDVSCGFSCVVYTMLRKFSSVPSSLQVFLSQKYVVFHQMVFLHQLRLSCITSPFSSVNVIRYTDFCILNSPCIPEINPTHSWFVILLMCSWVSFADLKFLCLCLSGILACDFPFLWYFCLALLSGWCWPHRRSLEAFPPLHFVNFG